MKKLILVFVVMVITITKMAAQQAEIKSTGIHFIQPVTDKQWSNHKSENTVDAKYKEYSGITYITLASVVDTEVRLDYDITVNGGKLEMEVTDVDANTILEHSFSENKKAYDTITLAANKEYRVQFKGKNTSGSYWCQWKAIK